MEQSVNYIVVFYGGKRRYYGNETPIDKFIDRHINYLDSNPKHITDFTFVFNKSDNPNEKNCIEKCENFIKDSHLNGNIIIRENKSGSYGAWNDAIIKYHKNTTHCFLIEDDYIPTNINFLEFFLKKDNYNISFVASYFQNNHAAIANGLINNLKVLETLNNYGRVFRILGDDNEYGNGLYHTQYQFLQDVVGEITDITDIGYTVFYTPEKNINYIDDNLTKLIEPILLYYEK